ncbi:MAG: hypothetical protein NTY12_05170 [Candidatus Falkowbacteria bacterium]|nr:hypothetical protein [Candidatus Falkowbacteria bacterium]
MVNQPDPKPNTPPIKTPKENNKPEGELEDLDDMSDWFKNNLVNPEDNPFTRAS